MSEQIINIPAEPNIDDPLHAQQNRFAVLFFVFTFVSWVWCLSAGVIFVLRTGSVSSNLLEWLLLASVVLVSKLPLAILTWAYAARLKMPYRCLLILLAIVPLLHWLALFRIFDYVPAEEEPSPAPFQWQRLGALVGLPMIMFPMSLYLLLLAIRPEYMMQLFYGPPIGTYTPATQIPLGWILLATIGLPALLLYGQGIGLMWMGFGGKRKRPVWLVISVGAAAFIYYLIPACGGVTYFTLLGPAAVQLCKQMFGCE